MTQSGSLRFEWDRRKSDANRRKQRLAFEEAVALFTSGAEYLEIFDADHSAHEERFVAIGSIDRGVIVVAWTERSDGKIRIISARFATTNEIAAFRRHMEEST